MMLKVYTCRNFTFIYLEISYKCGSSFCSFALQIQSRCKSPQFTSCSPMNDRRCYAFSFESFCRLTLVPPLNKSNQGVCGAQFELFQKDKSSARSPPLSATQQRCGQFFCQNLHLALRHKHFLSFDPPWNLLEGIEGF